MTDGRKQTDYQRLAFVAFGTSSWETMVHFLLLTNAKVGAHFGVLDTGSAWEDIARLCQQFTTDGRSIKQLYETTDSLTSIPAGFAKVSPYGSAYVLSDGPRRKLLKQFEGLDYYKSNIVAFMNASGGCGGGTGPFLRELLSPAAQVAPASRNRVGNLFAILNITAADARERDNVRYSLPRYCGTADYQNDILAGDSNAKKFNPVRGFDLLALIDARQLGHPRDNPEKITTEWKEWFDERIKGTDSHFGAAPVDELETLIVADRHAAHVASLFAGYSMSLLGRSRDFGDTYTKMKEIKGFRAFPFVVPHLWPVREKHRLESVDTPEKLVLHIDEALKSYHSGGGCLCGSCSAENNGSPTARAALVFLEGPPGFWNNSKLPAFVKQREVISRSGGSRSLRSSVVNARGTRPTDFVLDYLDQRFPSLEYSDKFTCDSATDEVRMCIMLWGPTPYGLEFLSKQDDTRKRELPMSKGYMQETDVAQGLEQAALKLMAPSSLHKAFKGWHEKFVGLQSRSGLPDVSPDVSVDEENSGVVGGWPDNGGSGTDSFSTTVPVPVESALDDLIESPEKTVESTGSIGEVAPSGENAEYSNTGSKPQVDDNTHQDQGSDTTRGTREERRSTRRGWGRSK
ncbi:MAG: hypothetical protein FJW26_14820 [Acidimicrobiia bacterium]|nr:hypothetical protein [Acidimicrobiia bacterium]